MTRPPGAELPLQLERGREPTFLDEKIFQAILHVGLTCKDNY